MPRKQQVQRNGDNEDYVTSTAFDYADALLEKLDALIVALEESNRLKAAHERPKSL